MRAAGLARQSTETKQQPPSPPSNASIFSSLDLLFHGLRAAANSPGKCSFHGRSPISDDLLHVDDDCAVDVVNEAVYKLIHELKERVLEDTHWRFTSRGRQNSKNVFTIDFVCSQDEGRERKAKPSTNPETIHRERVNMTRYPCGGKLAIQVDLSRPSQPILVIKLHHLVAHADYEDVRFPAGARKIVESLEDSSISISVLPKHGRREGSEGKSERTTSTEA